MSDKHCTMFKDVKGVVIQCVIKPAFKEQFEGLGFVDHIDLVKKAEKDGKQRRTRKRNVQADENIGADE